MFDHYDNLLWSVGIHCVCLGGWGIHIARFMCGKSDHLIIVNYCIQVFSKLKAAVPWSWGVGYDSLYKTDLGYTLKSTFNTCMHKQFSDIYCLHQNY